MPASEETPDFSELTTDDLLTLARQATTRRRDREQAAARAAEEQGALIAELSRRPGWTFARIAAALGLDDSTAHRYARPFLRKD